MAEGLPRFDDAEPHEDAEEDRAETGGRPVSRQQPTLPPAAPTPALAAEAAPAPAPLPRRSLKRPLLFALLPVALVAGGYAYVTGGRVVETDNAYVGAPMLGVSTDVSGTVIGVEVHNNEAVAKGQVLFRLKPDSYRVALEAAEAQLGTVRNQVLTLRATYKQSVSQIDQAKADLPYFETAAKRQTDLMATGSASRAIFDQSQHDLIAAQAKVAVAKTTAQAMLAQLGGDPFQQVEDNPFFQQAKAAVDNARRDLDDTVVRAPFDGVVTNVDALQVGAYLQAAQPGFSLVSGDAVWVDASPKETELTNVRPGQHATVTVDTYPGVSWEGSVESLSPASGSAFSLLPAQNTTGNWVKVVQRIPMRVRVEADARKPPLRVGMSAEVEVDTGKARGWPEFAKPWLARLGVGHG